MSFFNKLISTATANFRPPPSPSSNPEAGEGSFLFDDGAASHIVVDPPSEVLGQALAEIQQIGEGSVPRKLEVRRRLRLPLCLSRTHAPVMWSHST